MKSLVCLQQYYRINRIRLEFKDDIVADKVEDKDGINRIRLEFKAD